VPQLPGEINELLKQDLPPSELQSKILALSLEFRLQTKEIWALYRTIQQEHEQEESRLDRAVEVNTLLKLRCDQLNLYNYLHPTLAKPLEAIASSMGATSAVMLVTLLPVAASLLRVGTQLELMRATDFCALPILYTGIVAESASGKSPAQKTIITPLYRLQAEAEKKHQKQMEEWRAKNSTRDSKDEAPDKPLPREYFITDATREAIAQVQSQQPGKGLLGFFDELSGLIGQQGEYKRGKGADKEAILSGRDGTGIKISRASGKRLFVERTSYSITGGTQPDTLRNLIGDFSDPSGLWARFSWTIMPIQPAPFFEGATTYDISELLLKVYKQLESFTVRTYRLSSEAKDAFRQRFNQLDELRMKEPRQGLRAVYGKMKGDLGVFALLLHCLNAAIDGREPEGTIALDTIEASIALTKYFTSQVKLIHSEGDAANGDLSVIYEKLVTLSNRKGWLRAKDVQDSHRLFKNMKPETIRNHFKELEAIGFGATQGTGAKLQWSYVSKENGGQLGA
jgi:CRISPR-associated protein Cmr3